MLSKKSHQQKMKKSLFNKIIETVLPALGESKSEPLSGEEENDDITPNPSDPDDVTFAKVFTNSGGKFIYCSDTQDFYANFKKLLSESDWNATYCSNDQLRQMLLPTDLSFEENHTLANASVSTCEFLIAFNGSVMVSGNQTKNLKIEELPEALVVVAYTSQIVKNISEGLRGIQTKYGKSRPELVTTIRTKESITTMSDADRAKDLYIFLIEDYKDHR